MKVTLTDRDLESIDKDASDDWIESWEEEQKAWIREDSLGLPGGKRDTASRLKFYDENTLIQERDAVLDKNYREGLEAGIYAPLVPEVWYVITPDGRRLPWFDRGMGIVEVRPLATQEEALMLAQAFGLWTPPPVMIDENGMPVPDPMAPPPPIAMQPNFWWIMFSEGQFPSGWSLMRHHSGEFRNLLEERRRRLERAMAPILGGAM